MTSPCGSASNPISENCPVARAYNITWPSSEACDQGLAFFAEYRLSDGFGLLDALIASLAVELNAPLHTFNEKHYQPILEVETVQPYERRDA